MPGWRVVWLQGWPQSGFIRCRVTQPRRPCDCRTIILLNHLSPQFSTVDHCSATLDCSTVQHYSQSRSTMKQSILHSLLPTRNYPSYSYLNSTHISIGQQSGRISNLILLNYCMNPLLQQLLDLREQYAHLEHSIEYQVLSRAIEELSEGTVI